MDETETRNWRISYISCESNHRHTVVSCPADWTEDRVLEYAQMSCGGCGDDMAEIESVEETNSPAHHNWS